ncbi:MAG: DUF11 domain-containing protein [Burkholderiaceae bacterium]|nr:DUF11 domain-containing protein [Burkholderiaceae bacterium]
MAEQNIYLYATQSPPASIDTGEEDFPDAPGVMLADGTIFYTWKDDPLKTDSSGTGIFDPFLTIQQSGSETGTNLYNGSTYATGNAISSSDNRTSLLEISKIPVVGVGDMQYLEIRLDLNEVSGGGGPKAEVRMTDLKIYGSNDSSLSSFAGLTPLYSIDSAALDTTVHMWDDFNGSGRSDVVMLIPKSYFASNPQYLYFQTTFQGTDGGFEEFSTQVLQAPLDPSVTIEKTADVLNSDRSDDTDDIIDSAGDIVTYTVSASNPGDVPLTNPTITDPLIADSLDTNDDGLVNAADIVSGDTNDNGLLDVGETWVWQGEYTVTQADMDARGNYDGPDVDAINDNVIRNVVAISTDEGASDDAVADSLLDYNPVPNIEKTYDVLNSDRSDDPDDLIDIAGDIVQYSLSVRNDGNITLRDVVITDPLIADSLDTNDDGVVNVLDSTGGDDGNGLLDVGETWTFAGEYTVTQADMDARGNYDELSDGTNDNVIRNAASVEVKTLDQSLSATTRTYTDLNYEPLISIEKLADVLNSDRSDDADDVVDTAGDIITYNVSVRNEGNITLTDVVLTDALIADSLDTNNDGLVNAADIVSGDTNDNGLLDVGETWAFTGEYSVSQADIDNHGNHDSIDPDTINDNVMRNVVAVTSKASDQNISDDTFVDTRVIYGPDLEILKTANVSEVDAAGDEIEYTVTVNNIGNVTLTNVVVTDPLSGLSETIASLAPGASESFTATYLATQGDFDTNGGGDGDIDNTATADSDETDVVTASYAVDLLYNPAMSISKTANVESVDEVGDKILYSIEVSNVGNVTLTDVTLEDTLIEDTLDNDANDDGVIDGDDGDGLLEVGETWVWHGEYTVTQTDYDEALATSGDYYIRNTATADSAETDPVTSSEEVSLVKMAFEGLSPGYWKNHPDDWDGLLPSASFETFFFGGPKPGLNWKVKTTANGKDKFATTQDITMEQALALTGGSEAALARSAVAAVLNSRDEDVTYRFTEAQIKEWVSEALSGQPVDLENDGVIEYAAGAMAIGGVKDLLDFNNNLGVI